MMLEGCFVYGTEASRSDAKQWQSAEGSARTLFKMMMDTPGSRPSIIVGVAAAVAVDCLVAVAWLPAACWLLPAACWLLAAC